MAITTIDTDRHDGMSGKHDDEYVVHSRQTRKAAYDETVQRMLLMKHVKMVNIPVAMEKDFQLLLDEILIQRYVLHHPPSSTAKFREVTPYDPLVFKENAGNEVLHYGEAFHTQLNITEGRNETLWC